jgi:hypothetical protein
MGAQQGPTSNAQFTLDEPGFLIRSSNYIFATFSMISTVRFE